MDLLAKLQLLISKPCSKPLLRRPLKTLRQIQRLLQPLQPLRLHPVSHHLTMDNYRRIYRCLRLETMSMIARHSWLFTHLQRIRLSPRYRYRHRVQTTAREQQHKAASFQEATFMEPLRRASPRRHRAQVIRINSLGRRVCRKQPIHP